MLRARREAAGLSQRATARYLGVSQPTVWRWERTEAPTWALFLIDWYATLRRI